MCEKCCDNLAVLEYKDRIKTYVKVRNKFSCDGAESDALYVSNKIAKNISNLSGLYDLLRKEHDV